MDSEEMPKAGDLFSVDNLVAAVTGAAGGIGLTMARALEANGAKVFILDMDSAKLEEAQKQSKFGKLIPIKCDITSQQSLLDATDEIKKQVGYINLLIANAGVPGPYPPQISEGASISDLVDAWWKTPIEAFVNTYRVNDAGTFYTVLAFLKLLAAGNEQRNVEMSSQIIMTASIAAFSRQAHNTGFSYATSKAGVIQMMKQFATYLVPHDIRCNAIAPGLYPTDMSKIVLEKHSEALVATIPAGRVGSAKDMAGTILFLASRGGSYCNGMVTLTDGGRLGTLPATY